MNERTMYKTFYKLKKNPFQLSSDESFIWFNEEQKKALESLKGGIIKKAGFFLVTGGVGTGKTTFVSTLIKRLGDDVIHASVLDPRLRSLDLLYYIAGSYDLGDTITSRETFHAAFTSFLNAARSDHKRVLLVIDEAHLLDQKSVNEIKRLSDLPVERHSALSIVLVGHTDCNDLIETPENSDLKRQLVFSYTLQPLDLDETTSYIKHQFLVSGAEAEIFDRSALQEIHRASGGFPRQINVICDYCLKDGYEAEKKVISNKEVSATISERSLLVDNTTENYSKDADTLLSDDYIPSDILFESFDRYEQEPMSLPDESDLPEEPEDKRSLQKIILATVSIFFIAAVAFTLRNFTLTKTDAVLEQPPQENEAASIPVPPSEPKPTESSIDSGKPTEQAAETVPSMSASKLPVASPAEENRGSSPPEPTTITAFEAPLPTPVEPSENMEFTEPPPMSEGVPPIEIVDLQFPPSLPQEADIPAEDSFSDPPEQGTENLQTNISISSRKDEPARMVEKLERQAPAELLVIQFGKDSTELTGINDELIAQYLEYLKDYPEAIVIVAGHSDSWGEADYNLSISKIRAQSVADYLLQQGVTESQIMVRAYGEDQPIASNDTSGGRELNRRVEVSIFSGNN